MGRSFISNSVSIQNGAKISKSLTKSIQRFYMPSKSVMKFHIMKLKCFSESKQIAVFLMNLNRNWNTFRWKMKIIFRTSKGRLKDFLFYWDERTNFERTKDVYFRSRADWVGGHVKFFVAVRCFGINSLWGKNDKKVVKYDPKMGFWDFFVEFCYQIWQKLV